MSTLKMVGGKLGMGLRKAKVTKVTGDKTDCNNITVQLYSDGLELENVPVLVDMASKEFGRVVVPKEGDTVAVGFFDDNMEEAVVLGSFYTPNKKPPIKVDDKNNINYFQTATGMKITINDSDDKAGVFIQTKDKHTLELSDNSEQSVTISDKDKKTVLKIDFKKSAIEIKCKTLNVTAEDSAVIKAGNTELSLKNNSGAELKAQGDIKMSAKSIQEKANAEVKLEGANINANAKAKFEAKANAQVSIKSSAMAEFGGAMVKIG